MSRVFFVAFIVAVGATPLPAEDVVLELPKNHNEHEKVLREVLVKTAEDAPMTDAMKKSIEIVARYHVYQLTQIAVQNNPKVMSTMVDVCERWIQTVYTNNESRNDPVKTVFHEHIIKELDRIIRPEDQTPIVKVNGSRLLARLADRAGREEVADILVKVLTDTQQVDGARFYACQGLKEVMSKTPRNAPGIKDPKRRAEVVSALVSFIERKPPFTPSSVEEADGLCMIRREAIRALALVREPMIAGAPNGHVALCLARVVGKDASLTPVPRLDERLEASIGLGRLLADAQNDFQPGYAVNLIGQFVVEFGQVHKDRGKIKNFQREPWKVHAARLDDALKDMAKTFMKENMVASIQNLTNPIFEAVIRGSDSDTNALSNFVAGTPPAMKQVYKSDPKSVIAPRPVAKE